MDSLVTPLIGAAHFVAEPIISVLDDFLIIGSSYQSCSHSLAGFQTMCRTLNVPLHPDKTELPCQRLQFLGMKLDVAECVKRLPQEKIDQARLSVTGLLTRKKAPLRQVQACIDLLNFACLAVPLGRPFLRRLSDLCIGVRRPHHRVSITKAARLNLRAWMLFLASFNGRSLLDQRRWLRSRGLLINYWRFRAGQRLGYFPSICPVYFHIHPYIQFHMSSSSCHR